ncbi:conserved phage C-terminal domain-containing protein [Pantoea agglomerans]|uniref:conserved phage C-terminal domain-containing protein n=1 Tax=Enterobacter agglomerans TaxID=549 RepID=UPI00320B87BF
MSRTFDIIQSMSGQKNVIVIPRPYLKFFRGEQQAHALAAVLNNLVFWSAFGDDKGWFYKTYEELGEEAGGLSKDQTERLVKKLVKNHLSDAIHTCVRKVNGTPTMHYKVDGDSLISLIFKDQLETANSRLPKREVATLKSRSNDIETEGSRNLGNREVAESFLYTDVNTDLNIQTNKPSCQVASQPDDEWSIVHRSREVLRHLNKVTGAKHTEAKSSMGHIKSRLKDAFTVEELCLVVDYKHVHWEGTEEYQYMRPKTLFIPGNLPGYLQSATKWDKAGRPPRSEWNALKRNMQRDITVIPQPDSSVPHGFRG